MNILLLNAGSSSLKATLMQAQGGSTLWSGLADWAGTVTRYQYESLDEGKRSEEVPWQGHVKAVERLLSDIPVSHRSALAAVGHRIVHGGSFTNSVRITPEIRSQIHALVELAPLHNPPSLETLAVAESLMPDLPHVAVFDTAFHATLPPEAYTYAVPQSWMRDWGIRRYGFHGLSHAYCARRAAEILSHRFSSQTLRLVICHLGHGCSASAVRGGKCIDTSMGFTPLDGLMMATRCGSIDPGIVLHVQSRHGLSTVQVETILNRQSGLLGVSGISADMRQVLAASNNGNEQAQLALKIYAHRVRQSIGAFAVTMGGIDGLVFTAGVGEHSAHVRASVCDGLKCLGLELDAGSNDDCIPDSDVASSNSAGRILVIATREDLSMWEEVILVLSFVSRQNEAPDQNNFQTEPVTKKSKS